MSQSQPPERSAIDSDQLPALEQPTRVRWMIFALACSTSFILYLHRYTWGFMKADIAEEFDWNPATLGIMDSCFNLSYAIGQIPLGVLGDWFGPAAVLGSTIGLWSLAMGATTLATGLTTMYIARFMFGLTQAGCYSNLSKVTKVWFPLSVRTTVQGWVASFFGRSGGAMSNILFGTVLLGFFALTWRQAIGVMTLVGFVFTALFVYLFRNSPGQHPWSNDAEAELISADDPDAALASGSKLKWSVALRSGNMWIFLFQQFTSAFADNLYPYWIPLFLLVQKGVDTEAAGLLAALPLLGGAVGGMVGGNLQNSLILRTGNRRWVRSSIGCTGKMLAAVFMFVSLGFDSAVVILWLFAVVKFFGDWSQPTVWGTTTDIGGRNSASVFALVNTVGSIAGFVAGPTMGALILLFSQSVAVEADRPTVGAVRQIDDAAEHVTKFTLSQKAIVEGSPQGTLYADGRAVARFSIDKHRQFEFQMLGQSPPTLLPGKSKLHANKGEITIAWSRPPVAPRMQLDYQYTKYGAGWTALFVALGLIYLASSLSWLFIDCTKKLEG